MVAQRVKIDISDGEGNKITITFKGKITRSKVLQLLDFTELIGDLSEEESVKITDLSKFEKLQTLLERKFPLGWFTSQDVMISYEDTYEEPVLLSTISTYLSRLSNKDFLIRSGSIAGRRYRLKRTKTTGIKP